MQKADKDSGKSWVEEVTVKQDEGIRPDTTLEGVFQDQSRRFEGGTDRGREREPSSFSDRRLRLRRDGREARRDSATGKPPRDLPRFACRRLRGRTKWGIGPCFAVPRLLARTGLRMEGTVGLWEIERGPFAVQVNLTAATGLSGIPNERF